MWPPASVLAGEGHAELPGKDVSRESPGPVGGRGWRESGRGRRQRVQPEKARGLRWQLYCSRGGRNDRSIPGPLIAWREADAPPLRVFQPMVSVGMRTDTLRVEFSLRLRCSTVTACVQNRIIGRAPTGPVLP